MGKLLRAGLVKGSTLMEALGMEILKTQTAVFNGIEGDNRLPLHLHLTRVERLENDVIWLRYRL